jgi:hypothetical protein
VSYKRPAGVKPRKVILKEGDPRVICIVPINPMYLICCDCGNTHRYRFKVIKDGQFKGRVGFVAAPAKRKTAANRKAGRFPFGPRSK